MMVQGPYSFSCPYQLFPTVGNVGCPEIYSPPPPPPNLTVSLQIILICIVPKAKELVPSIEIWNMILHFGHIKYKTIKI
jgi:hypothetical protein